MTLQEIKKTEVDEVSFDEKVLLATHALNWLAMRNEKVYQQLLQTSAAIKKNGSDLKFDLPKKHEESRNKLLEGLTKLMEDFGNFVDGCDALDAIDTIVTTPAYDIVYDRYQPETKSNETKESRHK